MAITYLLKMIYKYKKVIDLLKSNRPVTLYFRGKGIPQAVKP